jgi:dihydrofolate reductase
LSERPALAMIAAMTDQRVIGHGGAIPWHHPEDMKHFVRVTKGHAIIMGRTTHESIGKPLPSRRNIVVSRRAGLAIEGCEIAATVEDAIRLARQTDDCPIVIGGAQIYEAALPAATRLYLTFVHEDHDGDVFFPAIDPAAWEETERAESGSLSFVTLERR